MIRYKNGLEQPVWAIKFFTHPKFWFNWWTPTLHKGRGPYISIGLGWMAIYRGY